MYKDILDAISLNFVVVERCVMCSDMFYLVKASPHVDNTIRWLIWKVLHHPKMQADTGVQLVS